MHSQGNNAAGSMGSSVVCCYSREITRVKPKMFWALMALCFLLTFIVYLPSLDNGFVNWDDPYYVQYNPLIRSLDLDSILGFFTKTHAFVWIPFTLLSLAVDYQIGGLDPQIYHMHNLLLHCLNTVLVYLLGYTIVLLTKPININNIKINHPRFSMIVASISAIIFGLHPLHVESVAWITERKDVLYAFFFLLSVHFYLLYAMRANSRWCYYASLGMMLASLFSKSSAVTLPFVLLLLDYWPLNRYRSNPGSIWLEKIPFFAISILGSLAAVFFQGLISHPINLPMAFRVMNAFHSLVFYLYKFAYPIDLATLYPIVYSKTFSPEYVLSTLVALAALYAVYDFRKFIPFLFVASLYYLVTLSPSLGILHHAGSQAAADRFMYMPSLGFTLLIAYVMCRFLIRWRLLFLVITLGVLCSLGYKTRLQIHTWRNSTALWEHTLKVVPDNSKIAFINLADAYKEEGRLEDAFREFKRASLMSPPTSYPHDGMGEILLVEGSIDESVVEFNNAISIDPWNYSPYCNLASALSRKCMLPEALDAIQNSIRLEPGYSVAYNTLGIINVGLGRFDDAVSSFTKALILEPHAYHPAYLRNTSLARQQAVVSRNRIGNTKASITGRTPYIIVIGSANHPYAVQECRRSH